MDIYLWYSNYVFCLKCHPLIQSVYHVLLSFCSTSLIPNTIWTLLSSSGLHPFVLSLLFMTWWQQKRQKTVVQHHSLWIILSPKHANGWVVTPLRTFFKTFIVHTSTCMHYGMYVCINHGLCLCYQTVCVLKQKCSWILNDPHSVLQLKTLPGNQLPGTVDDNSECHRVIRKQCINQIIDTFVKQILDQTTLYTTGVNGTIQGINAAPLLCSYGIYC